MEFSTKFITATRDFTTFEKHIPAPYFRKSFHLQNNPKFAEVTICGLGFYDLYINGKKITKGYLAPYISNPDDLIYFDNYKLTDLLRVGENIIGVQLGNGMQNAPGGRVWDFHLARFRGAPKLALTFEAEFKNEDELIFEADESFKTAPSPVWFDDLRCGEFYDARKEIPGWNEPGFDDSNWSNALIADKPRGEGKLCEAEPIVKSMEIPPVEIRPAKLASFTPRADIVGIDTAYKPKNREGFLYDFGVNIAGLCRLKINGTAGQQIELQFCEYLEEDGSPSYSNINFFPDGYAQRDIYICKGDGEEYYTPSFTYHGFRYCVVMGITAEQAKPELLTCLVLHSDLEERGSFKCSDEMANTLQELTRRSDLSNFHYFPTDCPHREKNGWTGDAAISCEHMTLNLSPEKSFSEWLCNVRKAQAEDGSLPGIVPTTGWGFAWGNGPAWDCALTYLPYYTYMYRGDKKILQENATAIFRYLHYIGAKRGEDGLIKIGLGDWLHVARDGSNHKAPLEFTDSVITMSICEKAAFIFGELGLTLQQQFAQGLYGELRAAVRERLVDFGTMTVTGRCQSTQSMAIYYDVFEPGEKQKAFEVLLQIIRECGGHIDFGILGARVIFHVLSEFGMSDLAYNMITRTDFPSYGYWVAIGATSLWEDFQPKGKRPNSLNHHFFGDISNWFISKIAGLQVNPYGTDVREVHIKPSFVTALDHAQAHYDTVAGRVETGWRREGDEFILKIKIPSAVKGKIILPAGYVFGGDDEQLLETATTRLMAGEYKVRAAN
ncbi:MAG TPA: family 78 glycoside hydrolase catalytic domain [Clostridia bacterium]|nr:family 78 glycoside hydrolase catalytic domain [Clostridia bacterium]